MHYYWHVILERNHSRVENWLLAYSHRFPPHKSNPQRWRQHWQPNVGHHREQRAPNECFRSSIWMFAVITVFDSLQNDRLTLRLFDTNGRHPPQVGSQQNAPWLATAFPLIATALQKQPHSLATWRSVQTNQTHPPVYYAIFDLWHFDHSMAWLECAKNLNKDLPLSFVTSNYWILFFFFNFFFKYK